MPPTHPATRKLPAAWHTANWKVGDGNNASAGVYFARMTINGETFTRRVVVLR